MLRNLLILLLFASCGAPGWDHNADTSKMIDTVYLRDTVYIPADTTEWVHQVDSLEDQLFLARYKIERVKYYLNIVDRNPSQLKFLKGWVGRAVER